MLATHLVPIKVTGVFVQKGYRDIPAPTLTQYCANVEFSSILILRKTNFRNVRTAKFSKTKNNLVITHYYYHLSSYAINYRTKAF